MGEMLPAGRARAALVRVVLALSAAGSVALLALGPGSSAADPSLPPNILIIVSDDQPIGTTDNPDPNCQSTPVPPHCKLTQTANCTVAPPATPPASCYTWMPNLVNWFKINGTKFGQAFATTPLCCPSRASIFTGRYAHNHKVITNDLGKKIFADPNHQRTTLQYYLQRHGYRTAIFGKFLNEWVADEKGAPPNFDEYAIYDNGRHLGASSLSCQDPNTGKGMACVLQNQPGQSTPAPRVPINQYETTFLADKVEQFISTAPQPWLLVVTPTVPHAPFQPDPAKPYAAANFSTPAPPGPGSTGYFETDNKPPSGFCTSAPCPAFSGKPPYVKVGKCVSSSGQVWTKNPNPWPPTDPAPPPAYDPGDNYKSCILLHRDYMFRMLKSVDDLVGSIRTTLNSEAAAGQREPLAFYISDNGYLWGQHWLEAKPHPYTESTRVPFFMSGPGVAKNLPGGDSGRMVANVDIAPTVIKAVGLPTSTNPLNAPMDGGDLIATPRFARNHILLERPGRLPPYSAPGVCSAPGCAAPTASNPPLWASIRTLAPATGESQDLFGARRPYQYVETYGSASAPYDSDAGSPTYGKIYIRPGIAPTWSEFYDLATEPFEVTNGYGDDLVYSSGDAGANPADPGPGQPGLHTKLHELLACKGHGEVPTGTGSFYPACP